MDRIYFVLYRVIFGEKMEERKRRRADRNEADEARALLRHSHLSHSTAEDVFTEFEFALHHLAEAFARWSSALHEYVSGEILPVQDVSVLQVIRMNERPKSATEIGKFLNRDDASNILYTLRKLEKAGLIEKSGGSLRQTTYRATAHGRKLTDLYAEIRRDILLGSVGKLEGSQGELAATTQTMWRISGLYEQSARKTSMRRMLQTETSTSTTKRGRQVAKEST